MTKQGWRSSYSNVLKRQGWLEIERDFAQLFSAVEVGLREGRAEAVVAILQKPLAEEEGGGEKETGGGQNGVASGGRGMGGGERSSRRRGPRRMVG